MASFLERCTYKADTADDGGQFDPQLLRSMLRLYADGSVDGDWVADALGVTAGQRVEMDEVLATLPAAAADRSAWIDRLYAVAVAGAAHEGAGFPGFETLAELRGAIGLV